MSDYSTYVSNSRRSESGSLRVGDVIDSNQTIRTNHPIYQGYTEKLADVLKGIIIRESEKHTSAPQAVCAPAVDPEARSAITKEYPEFRIVWPTMSTPVHTDWVARRALVNQVMTYHARSYASTFVHYGGSALSYITAGIQDVHLEVDSGDPVAMHESHTDDVQCAQLMVSPVGAAAQAGWLVEPSHRDEYLHKRRWLKCNKGVKCFHAGDALIVDGSLYAISPTQFASAMLQHSSSVGYFALPFHPTMLTHSEGCLPGTAVQYSVDDHDVKFRYPYGVSGVTSYSAYIWNQWLLNTMRRLDATEDKFEYELVGVRGCFMVVRVVHVGKGDLQDDTVVHSIQLPQAEELTLVKTWRLKDLVSDPYKRKSWQEVTVTVPTRVVTKTVDYAMALDADQFSRYAIRKRLMVVNNRVVVQGTSVEVHEPLTADQTDVLEIAIFTRCFVMRYESGKLSSKLKSVVDQVARFGNLPFLGRLVCVFTASAALLYDWTIAPIDGRVRAALDDARRWLAGRAKTADDQFLPVPHFIRYEHIVQARSRSFLDVMQSCGRWLPAVKDLHPRVAGFSMLVLTDSYGRESPTVPLIDVSGVATFHTGDVFSDIIDTGEVTQPTDQGRSLYNSVSALNEVDMPELSRHVLSVMSNESDVLASDIERDDYVLDPGFVTTMREAHEALLPGMVDVDFTVDPTSIAVDDQDRTLAAEYMRLPSDFGEMPSDKQVYLSRLNAYGVLKRQATVHETLSALTARNLSAPVVAVPQDMDELVKLAFENFLDVACVPEARSKLAQYESDPVALEEKAFFDWTTKARPEVLEKVIKQLVDEPMSWEQLEIGRYEAMIKSDVKPPLSIKPLTSRVEPQVIVHHKSLVNSIFSSIFRVLVRRFLSLLRPNFMLNLLKDMPDVRNVMQTHHPWGAKVQYLENDFSKYDKSQGEFVLLLETYVFMRLGMNQSMLERWKLGHVECSIRSIVTGISLSVRYQRKSGDATTSFGNGLLNMISVLYAYRGSDIAWAVFMGDDSLICARSVVGDELAVRALAEQFNLLAKFYITDAPYFASNFVLVNDHETRITCLPDPVKRIEKWSMAIPAKDPKWEERYVSAKNAMNGYLRRSDTVGLGRALMVRYSMTDEFNTDSLVDAMATAISTFVRFRSMWEDDVSTIKY